jgi:hypothetical protein
MKRYLIWIACLLLGAAYAASRMPQSPQKPAHFHIDLKIYVQDKLVNLSDKKFQTEEGDLDASIIHLHDGNGDVVHFHRTGQTLRDMMKSLHGDITPNCFSIDSLRYCTGFTSSLKVFVNSKRLLFPHRYEPRDGDQVLITFGPHMDNDIENQLKSLSSQACVYSLKCPEKGEPPTENCIGNGTDPCVLPGTQ